MKILRTTNSHNDFAALVAQLDAELWARYGDGQAAYDPHNKIDPIDTAVVGYVDDVPVACGCFKEIGTGTVEIKRMFVAASHRRQGLSTSLLQALEGWGAELGYEKAVLETGKGQPEAIGLYRKCGYRVIENYGPYKGMPDSVCMEKRIGPGER